VKGTSAPEVLPSTKGPMLRICDRSEFSSCFWQVGCRQMRPILALPFAVERICTAAMDSFGFGTLEHATISSPMDLPGLRWKAGLRPESNNPTKRLLQSRPQRFIFLRIFLSVPLSPSNQVQSSEQESLARHTAATSGFSSERLRSPGASHTVAKVKLSGDPPLDPACRVPFPSIENRPTRTGPPAS
jgi:hypothetical protein